MQRYEAIAKSPGNVAAIAKPPGNVAAPNCRSLLDLALRLSDDPESAQTQITRTAISRTTTHVMGKHTRDWWTARAMIMFPGGDNTLELDLSIKNIIAAGVPAFFSKTNFLHEVKVDNLDYLSYVGLKKHYDCKSLHFQIYDIAMSLVYFIAANDRPKTWVNSFPGRLIANRIKKWKSSKMTRMAKLFGVAEDDYDYFESKLQEWRRCGAWYAWPARVFGPGSLLFLLKAFLPHTLESATRNTDKTRAGPQFMGDLRQKGLYRKAKEIGANAFMHKLVWSLVNGVAGTQQRCGDELFPGLEGREDGVFNVFYHSSARTTPWPTPPERVQRVSSHQPWLNANALYRLKEVLELYLQLNQFRINV
jgi:hypothetical protein